MVCDIFIPKQHRLTNKSEKLQSE